MFERLARIDSDTTCAWLAACTADTLAQGTSGTLRPPCSLHQWPDEMTFLLLIAILFVLPLAAATALHFTDDRIVDWRNADKYAYPNIGDYRAWPGPNSNTFVVAIIAAVPGMRAALPPTAVGKDFPIDRRWFGLTPSRTGIRLNLGGYFGIAIGWVEGVEVNLLSAVAGIDVRRPAIKLPGLGRLGLSSASWT
jgi:hypothetical protein